MRKIRKGDNVVLITGRDKGKRGDVTQIVDDEHVIVSGLNQVKKHQRPNPMKGEQGGIVNKDMPIHISNVALWNPVTRRADRVGFRTMQDGRKVYLAMVRLVKWEARTTLRLLVALPLLEAKTRQSLETTWLMDVSHFGGLWVHASSSLRNGEVMGDIREAIKLLELDAQLPDSMPAEANWSASVQAVLDVPPGSIKP